MQTCAQTFSPSLPPPNGGKHNREAEGGATMAVGGRARVGGGGGGGAGMQEGDGAVKLSRILTRLLSLSLALVLGEET